MRPSTSPLGPVRKHYLQVTAAPLGEPPEWVREKWVGLTLPLSQKSGDSAVRLTAGVLTGPRGLLGWLHAYCTGRLNVTEGYLVDALGALDVLEAAHPEAAAWWKEHRPDLFRPGRRFMFQKASGHVVETPIHGS